ncbi:MAG: hypothetical protein R2864_07575 [Syntrophotaleaceae bacterium]
MTGGTVYCHLDEAMGLTEQALQRRLAIGAQVVIRPLDEGDCTTLTRLLREYERALLYSQQAEEAHWVEQVRNRCPECFVKIVAADTMPVSPLATGRERINNRPVLMSSLLPRPPGCGAPLPRGLRYQQIRPSRGPAAFGVLTMRPASTGANAGATAP